MSGEPRYPRENFERDRYERALTRFRDVLHHPHASAPTTAADLAELERLITQYPEHARQMVAELPPPAAAPP